MGPRIGRVMTDARALSLRKCTIDASFLRSATPAPAAGLSTHVPGLDRVRCVHGGSRLSPADSTDVWCWHCCHPFDSPPLPMPVRYDDRRDVFHVAGTFCSWACMKAYNGSSNDYRRDVNAVVIALFRKRCTGEVGRVPVRPAPPRAMLRAFGGTMGIDEFRGASATTSYRQLPERMIPQRQVIEERSRAQPTTRARHDLGVSVDFTNVAIRNETLRLKRPKPLQNTKNLLERTMGINVL